MHRAAAPALAAAVLLVLPACGGAADPPGATHDSPSGAVRGFIASVSRGDLDAARQWVAPSARRQYNDILAQTDALRVAISFRVSGFQVVGQRIDVIHPDQAQVTVRGEVTVCASSSATANSAPSTCEPFDSGPEVSGDNDTFECVDEGGRWYITLAGSPPGSGG